LCRTGATREVKYSSNFVGSNVCVRGAAGRAGIRAADHSSERPPCVTLPESRPSENLPLAVRFPTLKEISAPLNVPSSSWLPIVPLSVSPACFSIMRVVFGVPKSTMVIAHAPDRSVWAGEDSARTTNSSSFIDLLGHAASLYSELPCLAARRILAAASPPNILVDTLPVLR
jgi:hypothetical protein